MERGEGVGVEVARGFELCTRAVRTAPVFERRDRKSFGTGIFIVGTMDGRFSGFDVFLAEGSFPWPREIPVFDNTNGASICGYGSTFVRGFRCVERRGYSRFIPIRWLESFGFWEINVDWRWSVPERRSGSYGSLSSMNWRRTSIHGASRYRWWRR